MTAEDAADRAGENGFRLEIHGRYSHSEAYLRKLMEENGLEFVWVARDVLRKECGQDVAGMVVVGKKL